MRKWLELRIGGQRVVVYVVRPGGKLLGKDERGCFEPDTSRIYISRQLGKEQREDTLIHEFRHAIYSISGAGEAMRKVVKPSQLEQVEEDMVLAETPHWLALLKDLGLVLPKGPFD